LRIEVSMTSFPLIVGTPPRLVGEANRGGQRQADGHPAAGVADLIIFVSPFGRRNWQS
jgi:hypothetical protein